VFGRSDRRTHRAKLRGFTSGVLERRARVGIDQLALSDVGVGPLNQQARVLALEQRPSNSAGPEVDPLARVFGDLVMDDHIRNL
jgi:hypothetical protein